MFAKNQILYSPGGLALKTNLRGPLPGRVWLLFFFYFINQQIYTVTINDIWVFVSRSVALDMPVRGSRIPWFTTVYFERQK